MSPTSNLTYYLYLRKSSESEDRQQASIPAQERELVEFGERRGLRMILPTFQETMSAKRPGRPIFEQMLEGLQRRRADGILCWHLDRLARNPLDGGRIMQALGDGVIKEIVTPNRSYTSADDKLMMAIEFGMSTKYVDDLSRNIARGQRESLEVGRWPGNPKIGYVRDRNINMLVPDPERFELVRDLWRLKLAGAAPQEIFERAATSGLTTPPRHKEGGRPIAWSHVYRIFRDPFYAGVMRWKGENHQGKHEPMVTWQEFQAVQTALTRGKTNTPKAYRHFFAYRGLLFCGSCQALVTAEYTTNRYGKRYAYYHCCRKNRTYGYCPERSIEEASLEEQLAAFFERLVLPDDVTQAVSRLLPELAAEMQGAASASKGRIAALVEQKKRQLERLRLLCADEVITPEELKADRERLLSDLAVFEGQLREDADPKQLIEPFESGISFVNQAVAKFRRGTPDERRALVHAVSSNLVLRDRKVVVQLKNRFEKIFQIKENPTLWAG